MTLKSFSFSRRLFGNRFGRDGWLMLLYGVILFFNFPVNLMLTLSNPMNVDYSHLPPAQAEYQRMLHIKDLINTTFYDSGSGVILLTAMMGIFSAVWLFSYLHRRDRVDFYHAQPVMRSQLFSMNLVSGLLYFVIPMAINLLLCVIALLFSGQLYLLSPLVMLQCFGSAVFEYFIFFAIGVFIGMLAGTVWSHLLGCVAAILILPALAGIPTETFSFCYKSYYTTFPYFKLFMHLSPVFALGEAERIGMTAECTIYYCFVILLLLAGAFLLYRKRPSEAAGKPIIYSRLQKAAHLVFTLVVAFFGGMLFPSFNVYGDGRRTWFIFGFFIMGFLSYMILHVILEKEVRACYRKLGRCALMLGIVFLLLCIPLFDLTGFDAYLPQRGEIESVNVYFGRYDNEIYPLLSPSQLDKLHFEDEASLDAVYATAQSAVQKMQEDDTGQHTESVYVRFHLKNGKNVLREYYYGDSEVNYQTVRTLYSAPEAEGYRRSYSAFTFNGNRKTNLWVEDPVTGDLLAVTEEPLYRARYGSPFLITQEQREALVEAFNEDVATRSFDEMSSCGVAVNFAIAVTMPSGNEVHGFSMPVLFCDHRTCALLSEYGIPMNSPSNLSLFALTVVVDATYYDIDPDSALVKEKADVVQETVAGNYIADTVSSVVRFTVTDPAQIQEILDVAVLSSSLSGHYAFRGTPGLYLEVQQDDSGYLYYNHFVIPNGQAPDFLKAELEKRRDEVLGIR